MSMRSVLPLFLLAAVLGGVLLGCAPKPDELYDRGQRLEVEGRLDEAFDHYTRALERAPDMQKARGRGRIVGSMLVERRMMEAQRAVTPPETADAYRDAAHVIDRARTVGLALDMPSTFETDRLAAYDAAVEDLIADGAAALDLGRFDEALGAFNRAEAYEPSGEQRAAIATFSFDTHLAWAEADLAAGRFRSAFARAEAALPYLNADRSDDAIRALQDGALAAGTVHVAVFPEETVRGRQNEMGAGFLGTFQDYMEDEYWTQPPLFIGIADPAEVRRVLRRSSRTDDRYDNLRVTGQLADDLEADFGVASLIRTFERSSEETDRDSLTVRLRSGGNARFARITERVTLDAELAFVVVAAGTSQRVCNETVRANASERIRRGEYQGRMRDLILDRGERALFDEDALADAERELEDELIAELGQRYAQRLFACLDRQVP